MSADRSNERARAGQEPLRPIGRHSRMTKLIAGIMVLGMLLGSCSVQDTTDDSVPSGGIPAVTMVVADTANPVSAQVGDVLRITWSSVDVEVASIADERCPSVVDPEVNCVWEGSVTTTLKVRSDGGGAETLVLEGISDGGHFSYGDSPWAQYDLFEVSVSGIEDDGAVMLWFSGLD